MTDVIDLSVLTKPFEVIQNTLKETRDKFLEGVPYKDEYFPGPFTNSGYRPPKSTFDPVKGMRSQTRRYPRENSGRAKCINTSQRNRIPQVRRRAGNAVRNIEGFKDMNLSDPENETGFGTIVPQFNKCSSENNPLLDISNRPVSHFSHNNMVPFYGQNVTQNMHGTGVPQAGDNNDCKDLSTGFADTTPYRDKLQTFTGTDEMYLHKREVGPMFSPGEQQDSNVYGSPLIRPDLDRFEQGLTVRNFENPIEKIQVGPGIGLDYTVPASGGFHQYTRVMPNNVNDYKANQLENRVHAGKWQVSNFPTSQFINGVQQNRPNTVYTQARRPTMATKFYTTSPDANTSRITDYTQLIQRGKQGRTQTEIAGGFGQLGPVGSAEGVEHFSQPSGGDYCVSYGIAPIGKTMGSTVPRQIQDRDSYTYIREPGKRGTADCLELPQGSYRWDLFGPAAGSVKHDQTRDGWYCNYTDRGTKNPFVINVSGTAGGTQRWNPNSFEDQARVTRKETTEYAYQGNPLGSPGATTDVKFSDLPKVTRKETMDYAYQGNPGGTTAFTTDVKFSDVPKVTRKETMDYAYQGNPGQGGTFQTDRFMYTGNYM